MVLLLLALLFWVSRPRAQDDEAQHLLTALERKLHLLVAHLQKHHPEDERTLRLVYKWDGALSRLDHGKGAGTATNKQHISVCLRDSLGKLQDPMTGFFTVAHEISHLATVSHGHTNEFWTNFRWLLGEAVAAGLYEYQNFRTTPTTYCGSYIDSSPLDDDAVRGSK